MARRSPPTIAVLAGVAVCVAVAVSAALIGGSVAGADGARTGALAGATGLVFPALTAGLVALLRRRPGRRAAARAFVGFLALILAKAVVFAACLALLLSIGGIHAATAYGALAVAGICSVAIDLVVVNGMRGVRTDE